VDAVGEDEFHVWIADTVEEAAEIAIGIPAGSRDEDDTYPDGTLYRLVDDRLRWMAETLTKFAVAGRNGSQPDEE
jgi:hypothetical protein